MQIDLKVRTSPHLTHVHLTCQGCAAHMRFSVRGPAVVSELPDHGCVEWCSIYLAKELLRSRAGPFVRLQHAL